MKKVFLYNTKTGMAIGYDENIEIYNRDFVRVNYEEYMKLENGASYQDILDSRSDFLKMKEAQVIASEMRKAKKEKAANDDVVVSETVVEDVGERPFSDVDFDSVTIEYLNGVKDEDLETFGKFVLNIGSDTNTDGMTKEARQAHYNLMRTDFAKMIAKMEKKRRG